MNKGGSPMNAKRYLRGMLGQGWYNFTECLAWAILYRKMPEELEYHHKVAYGPKKREWINTISRKDLAGQKKPLFVYIHGGGWVSGVTDMRNTYIMNWAKKGFFCASVSYTWAPQATYPGQVQEVYDALDFILDHAEEWGFDPDNAVVAGESAGGYYVMHVGSAAMDPSWLERTGLKFRHAGQFKPKALVDICGCIDMERLLDESKGQSEFPDMKMFVTTFLDTSYEEAKAWVKTEEGKLASPVIGPGFPPTFVIWATRDKLRFEAFDVIEELKAAGVPYDVHKCGGLIGNHAWAIATIVKPAQECLAHTWEFTLPYLPEYF